MLIKHELIPEWLKGADCKSAGLSYIGSNPIQPIKNRLFFELTYAKNRSHFFPALLTKKFIFITGAKAASGTMYS